MRQYLHFVALVHADLTCKCGILKLVELSNVLLFHTTVQSGFI